LEEYHILPFEFVVVAQAKAYCPELDNTTEYQSEDVFADVFLVHVTPKSVERHILPFEFVVVAQAKAYCPELDNATDFQSEVVFADALFVHVTP
jgi:hypothetical protein